MCFALFFVMFYDTTGTPPIEAGGPETLIKAIFECSCLIMCDLCDQ